jgi:peptidoglycan/LPS O-acetylase OafA/YrhL
MSEPHLHKPSERRPRHLDALTGLRGIAAWLVVLYHIRLSLVSILPPGVIAVLARGYLAVDLFFVLSGFVMWYNYAVPLASGGPRAAARFLWRRMARIWPLHLLILGGFVLFRAALTVSGRPVEGLPLDELPLQVLLIQNWGFTHELAWNHPAWSISTEFAAYLVFPAIVAAGQPIMGRRRLAIAIAALLLAGEYALFTHRGLRTLGADIPTMGLWRCLIGFMLGTLACVIWQAARSPRAWPWALFATGWIALGSVAGWPETAIVPPAIVTAMLALIYDKGPLARFLSSHAAVWLGEVSYSTYLAHAFLFLVFKLLFVDASLQIGWAGLAAYLLLLLIASWALYRLIEKPAQRWLNARTPGWTRPLPASPAE